MTFPYVLSSAICIDVKIMVVVLTCGILVLKAILVVGAGTVVKISVLYLSGRACPSNVFAYVRHTIKHKENICFIILEIKLVKLLFLLGLLIIF